MAMKRSREVPQHYSTLGLADTQASEKDVGRAYKQLALRLHPDRNPGSEAEVVQQFQRVKEAYAVLSNAERRAAYDSKYGLNLARRIAEVQQQRMDNSAVDLGERAKEGGAGSLCPSESNAADEDDDDDDEEYVPEVSKYALAERERLAQMREDTINRGPVECTISAGQEAVFEELAVKRAVQTQPWGMGLVADTSAGGCGGGLVVSRVTGPALQCDVPVRARLVSVDGAPIITVADFTGATNYFQCSICVVHCSWHFSTDR